MVDIGLESVAGAVGVVVGVKAAGVAVDALGDLRGKKKKKKKGNMNINKAIGF